ncbi:hypothetical protein [uncultured Allobaculum sp.]|uniref:hypothetical protein n=1 Tax=uncultured Allobaculum sp. TaxID=1187017 RepID=UPI002583C0B7|nr:hypothetical protein [uncultured Allobaculum sp.]
MKAKALRPSPALEPPIENPSALSALLLAKQTFSVGPLETNGEFSNCSPTPYKNRPGSKDIADPGRLILNTVFLKSAFWICDLEF